MPSATLPLPSHPSSSLYQLHHSSSPSSNHLPTQAQDAALPTSNDVDTDILELDKSWIARLKNWRYGKGRLSWEFAASCATILLVGINDSSTGANLPAMMETYNVEYKIISIAFLANTVGYVIASFANSFLLHHYGLKNTLLVAAAFYSAGSLILTAKPPFGVIVPGLMFNGLGSGLYDAGLTTVVAHYDNSTLMSCLYSFFGVGACISPLLIGSMIDRSISWNLFYIFPTVLSILLVPIHLALFGSYELPSDETTTDPPLHPFRSTEINNSARLPITDSPAVIQDRVSAQTRLRQALRVPAVWIGALLIILGFASTDALGSWLPSYLLTVKGAESAKSRYGLAGLWGGIALGRIFLIFPSAYLGDRVASIGFLTMTVGCLAAFWKIVQRDAETATIVLIGFFLGPVSPNLIFLITARVPPSLKSSVVSILIGLGLCSAALSLYLVGVVGDKTGLEFLPGLIVVFSALSIVGLVALEGGKERAD